MDVVQRDAQVNTGVYLDASHLHLHRSLCSAEAAQPLRRPGPTNYSSVAGGRNPHLGTSRYSNPGYGRVCACIIGTRVSESDARARTHMHAHDHLFSFCDSRAVASRISSPPGGVHQGEAGPVPGAATPTHIFPRLEGLMYTGACTTSEGDRRTDGPGVYFANRTRATRQSSVSRSL